MKKINELEKLRDDTTGDILRMLHDRVSAIEAKLEANTPQEEYVGVGIPYDDQVTRFEVIDENGRSYSRWKTKIKLDYQDNGRTLKVFVEPEKAMNEPHTSDTSFRSPQEIEEPAYTEEGYQNYYLHQDLEVINNNLLVLIDLLGKEQDNGKRD